MDQHPIRSSVSSSKSTLAAAMADGFMCRMISAALLPANNLHKRSLIRTETIIHNGTGMIIFTGLPSLL